MTWPIIVETFERLQALCAGESLWLLVRGVLKAEGGARLAIGPRIRLQGLRRSEIHCGGVDLSSGIELFDLNFVWTVGGAPWSGCADLTRYKIPDGTYPPRAAGLPPKLKASYERLREALGPAPVSLELRRLLTELVQRLDSDDTDRLVVTLLGIAYMRGEGAGIDRTSRALR